MVAPTVVVVMDTALLPLFCMVGVSTWGMTNSATTEDGKFGLVAIAFTVVGLVTENGTVYSVLEAVGSLLSSV